MTHAHLCVARRTRRPHLLGEGLLSAPLLALLAVVVVAPAQARPGGPLAFCEAYPESAHCSGRIPTCKLCHTNTGAYVGWNEYGIAVLVELGNLGYAFGVDGDEVFNSLVGQAALNVEATPVDHDGDGVPTLEEIALGTGPGDLLDYFVALPSPLGDPNPGYAVGGWDAKVAFTRVKAAFCGESPTYDEQQDLAALADDARRQAVHDALDACMASSYWKNEGLARLADDRIRPIPRFEQWRWDYRLWRYANLPPCAAGDPGCTDTEDRSALDLLTGTYHVREPAEGDLVKDSGAAPALAASCTTDDDCGFDEVCGGPAGSQTCRVPEGYQPLQDEARRAGMLTTTWYSFFFTMFSAMPRTAAAQAMRAHLGLDIARQQGLVYSTEEPADVDNKGVANVGCIECHMQLDGATYGFAYYNSIGDPGGGASQYNPNRPVQRGLWTPGNERSPRWFDTPVPDLPTWAGEAVQSEYFKRNHVLTFFRHATGRDPRPDEEQEVKALWQSMDADGYRTPALLHRLVDTLAFGGV